MVHAGIVPGVRASKDESDSPTVGIISKGYLRHFHQRNNNNVDYVLYDDSNLLQSTTYNNIQPAKVTRPFRCAKQMKIGHNARHTRFGGGAGQRIHIADTYNIIRI